MIACGRPPANQQKVEADTPINFALWRSKNSDVLTAKEWTLFDQAMAELKLKIMLDGQASGSEAVNAALRAKIDGMKLGEAIRAGLQIRLQRLRAERSVLEESLAINSQVRLREGDEDNASMLAAKLKMQSERLAKLEAMVSAAEADLQGIELKFR